MPVSLSEGTSQTWINELLVREQTVSQNLADPAIVECLCLMYLQSIRFTMIIYSSTRIHCKKLVEHWLRGRENWHRKKVYSRRRKIRSSYCSHVWSRKYRWQCYLIPKAVSGAKLADLSAGEVITTENGCFDDWQVKLVPWIESCSGEFAKAEKGWAVKVSKYLVISAQYVQC